MKCEKCEKCSNSNVLFTGLVQSLGGMSLEHQVVSVCSLIAEMSLEHWVVSVCSLIAEMSLEH